jgi:DNA-binding response OmpR family regulator
MTPVMSSSRIILVEDDARIAAGLVQALKRHGFEVELSTTGRAAVTRGLEAPPALAVLDLGLPDTSGHQVLAAWATRTSFPVVVLTARTDVKTRVAVFAEGAVDYLPKPFFVEELVARIEARLGKRKAPPRVTAWADVEVDLLARQVRREGRVVELTPHQLNVLAFLVERPGEAVSRERLAREVLSVTGESAPRTVDSHVARIRRALGPRAAEAIATVRVIGYRFDPGPAP